MIRSEQVLSDLGQGTPQHASMDRQTVNILIVEQQPDQIQKMKEALEAGNSSVRVDWASEGRAALDCLQQSTFEAILLGQELPDLDGLELCRMLAGLEHGAPIIFLLRPGAEALVPEVLEAGAATYLTKDVQGHYLTSLSGVVANVLAKWREKQSHIRSEKDLHHFFELSPDLFAIVDTSLNFRRINPAWQQVTGFPEAVLVDGSIIGLAHPQDWETLKQLFEALLDGVGTASFEARCLLASGGYCWLRWNVYFSNEENLIYAVARDVTADKLAEDELRRAKEGADAANRAKNSLLANMSHELRTPLTTIVGYLDLLKNELPDLAELRLIKRHLPLVSAATDQLLVLVTDILDMARLEIGDVRLNLEEIDVEDFANEIADHCAHLFDKSQNEFVVEVASNLGIMTSDKEKMESVLVNLLDNAAKFTHQGRVSFSVRREKGSSEAQIDADTIYFQVSDTGIGIPAEYMGLLFEPFSQYDAGLTRKYGGTGLGLAISKRFCRLLQGELTARSKVAVGSTFIVSLPARAPMGANQT